MRKLLALALFAGATLAMTGCEGLLVKVDNTYPTAERERVSQLESKVAMLQGTVDSLQMQIRRMQAEQIKPKQMQTQDEPVAK